MSCVFKYFLNFKREIRVILLYLFFNYCFYQFYCIYFLITVFIKNKLNFKIA